MLVFKSTLFLSRPPPVFPVKPRREPRDEASMHGARGFGPSGPDKDHTKAPSDEVNKQGVYSDSNHQVACMIVGAKFLFTATCTFI